MAGVEVDVRDQIVAFKNLGYSVLTATNVDMVPFLYRLFPDLVRVVIMQIRVEKPCIPYSRFTRATDLMLSSSFPDSIAILLDIASTILIAY